MLHSSENARNIQPGLSNITHEAYYLRVSYNYYCSLFFLLLQDGGISNRIFLVYTNWLP